MIYDVILYYIGKSCVTTNTIISRICMMCEISFIRQQVKQIIRVQEYITL